MTPREFVRRALGAVRRGRAEAELADELRFHREQLEAEYAARGVAPAEAHRRAVIDLGGAAQIEESWRDQRSLPAVEMLMQDVRYEIRILRHSPGFTIAALLTLAVGIGANTAMFTIVDAVLLRPLPYASPEGLMAVGDRSAAGEPGTVGFLTVQDWQARSRTFTTFALLREWLPTLVTDRTAERLTGVRVSWNYFDMLGVRPALGRSFTPEDDRPDRWDVVILSDSVWRTRWGADPGVIGRTLTMNDRVYRIVGVMPPSMTSIEGVFYFGGRGAGEIEMWAPLGYDASTQDACRSCQHLRAIGRLRPGLRVSDATAEMAVIRDQLRREHPTEYDAGSIAVVPLGDALTGRVRSGLLVLLGAVGFVLLIACTNVASLLIARSMGRQRELAMRSALGAGPSRILRQLLTESAMLGLAGGLGGIALAALSLQGLASLAAIPLPHLGRVAIDGRVLLFAAALTIATSVLFGMLPAWRAAGLGQASAGSSRTVAGGASRARAALVVLDLALALVLLAGAGLMLRTVVSLTKVSPGFAPDRILTLQFSLVGHAYAEDPPVVAFQNRALERIRALPGVQSVALADQVPFGDDFDCRGFHVKGRMKPNPADDPCIERYGVTPDYADVMAIPLRAGRFFTAADSTSSQPVIVISESTARLVWGSEDPLGAVVRIGSATRGPWRTVIGVVGDVHKDDLAAPAAAAIYTPESQFTDSYLVAIVKSSTADPAVLTGPVRESLRGIDPTVPVYHIATLSALVARATAQQLLVMRLLAGFAVTALLLAAIGLYGVVAYSVAQRTREMGVRIALGAGQWDVLRLVLSHGLTLVAAGVALGITGAFVATRFLGTLLYGVSPADPVSLIGAALVLATAALAAYWLPVRRALAIDPVIALRQE